jgi:FkbM family methyltransferase
MSDWVLPPGFATLPISDPDGATFQLVVSAENPGKFEQWQLTAKPFSEIATLVRALLRDRGTLIDLGANIGTVCLPVGMAGSRILAVEMMPQNVAKLVQAGLINEVRHLRVIQAAVTNTDNLIRYAGDEAWGYVTPEADATAVGLRLDTIIELVKRDSPGFVQEPVAIKIDVEGHELQALTGALTFLRRYRPAVVFESQMFVPSTSTVKHFVSSLGYTMYLMRGHVLEPHQPDGLQVGLIGDILALPQERVTSDLELLHQYEIRSLTAEEQIVWLDEMANADAPHREHAKSCVPILRSAYPAHADQIEAIARNLVG